MYVYVDTKNYMQCVRLTAPQHDKHPKKFASLRALPAGVILSDCFLQNDYRLAEICYYYFHCNSEDPHRVRVDLSKFQQS